MIQYVKNIGEYTLPEWHTFAWDILTEVDEPEKFETLLKWFKLPYIEDVEELYEDAVQYGTRLIVGYWATKAEQEQVLDAWRKYLEDHDDRFEPL